jgi:hypothetical protein
MTATRMRIIAAELSIVRGRLDIELAGEADPVHRTLLERTRELVAGAEMALAAEADFAPVMEG